jgi:drug/metabolite transporter (DMT)-like permease
MFPAFDPLPVAFGAAFAFGIADFMGGRAGARIGAAAAVAIVQTVATLIAIALVVLGGFPMPAGRDLWLGITAGVTDGIALWMLYKGLAEGRVGIVTPIASLISIGLPVVWEAAFIVVPPGLQLAGMALAALAVVIISSVPGDGAEAGRVRFSIQIGIACGLAFGVTNLTLGLVTPEAGNGALLVMRMVAILISIAAALVSPARPAITSSALAIALIAGVFDGIGLTGYVFAATYGLIGVAAAVLALYAGVTVLLGVIVLKERVTPLQMLGFLIAVVAAVLLTVGGE